MGAGTTNFYFIHRFCSMYNQVTQVLHSVINVQRKYWTKKQ